MCLVCVTKVRRRIKVHILLLSLPYHLLQAQKGKKKKGAEEESLISCYTCGLETEDPEVDQVSVNEMLIKLIMVK